MAKISAAHLLAMWGLKRGRARVLLSFLRFLAPLPSSCLQLAAKVEAWGKVEGKEIYWDIGREPGET